MDDDRHRWDDRYRGRPLAAPAQPEALDGHDDLIALLPTTGTALDVACGAGQQSLWLAERGMAVIALDVSPVAIDLTTQAARDRHLDDRIDARVCDLDAGLPDDIGDVDVVVCQRFRGRGLYGQLVEVLRPGGPAIVTVLSVVGVDGEAGEFHAPPGELLDAFSRPDTEILMHLEGSGLASIMFRRR